MLTFLKVSKRLDVKQKMKILFNKKFASYQNWFMNKCARKQGFGAGAGSQL